MKKKEISEDEIKEYFELMKFNNERPISIVNKINIEDDELDLFELDTVAAASGKEQFDSIIKRLNKDKK